MAVVGPGYLLEVSVVEEELSFETAAERADDFLRRLEALDLKIKVGGFCLHALFCLVEMAAAAKDAKAGKQAHFPSEAYLVAVQAQRLVERIAVAPDDFLLKAREALEWSAAARPALSAKDHLNRELVERIGVDYQAAKRGADTFWEIAAGLAAFGISSETMTMTAPGADTDGMNVDVVYVSGSYRVGVECKCVENAWKSLPGLLIKGAPKFAQHPVERGLFAVNVSRLLLEEEIVYPDGSEPSAVISSLLRDRFYELWSVGLVDGSLVEAFSVPAKPWILLYGEKPLSIEDANGQRIYTASGSCLLSPLEPHQDDEPIMRTFANSLLALAGGVP